MKKLIILFIILAIVISSFVGCTTENVDNTLKLGSMPTLSAAIYGVGIQNGIFEKHGVNVDLTIFKSAPERDSAAVAGELDGFMTDIMGLVNLVDKNFNFKATSYEYENFGIMVNKQCGIKNKNELNNEKIGISENTAIEYFVDQLLNESKVEKTQVVKIPDRLAAVLSNEIQLGVFPEPYISIIKANEGTEIVSSAKERLQTVILVFSQETIDKKDETIKSFYKAYNETVDYLKETDYSEYKDILIQYGLVKEDSIDKIKLPVDNFTHAKMPTENDFNKVIEWMTKKNLTENTYKLEDLSVDKYVK